jgi:hypothetical protein
MGRYIIYSSMIGIGLLAMYSILNAGSSESLLRIFFPSPASDVYVAAISSFIVFILGFVVFFTNDREGFRNLIALNGKKISALRSEGKSDEEIAESLLRAMGSLHGYRHRMARKKLILYLAEYQ